MPEVREKVTGRTGDIVEESLGLAQHDLDELCNEVFVVIHAAASVRFDEPLQKALQSNVHGLDNLLKLAIKMKNLQVECVQVGFL